MNHIVEVTLVALCFLAATTRAQGDEQADAILRRAENIAQTVKTYQADLTETTTQEGVTSSRKIKIRFLKPNYCYIALGMSSQQSGLQDVFASDGNMLFHVSPVQRKYTSVVAPTELRTLMATTGMWPDYFRAMIGSQVYTGEKTMNGVTYRGIKNASPVGNITQILYFGPSNLIEGIETTDNSTPNALNYSIWYTNVRSNTTMKPVDFVYRVPSGMTKVPISSALDGPTSPVNGNIGLISAAAASFTLPTPDNQEVSLQSLLSGKKALLITFWFAASNDCQDEVKKIQKLYTQFASKGLAVIAINRGDTAEEVVAFMQRNNLSLPVALAGGPTNPAYAIFSRYSVRDFPTDYIIDANGNVVLRAIEPSESALAATLAKLGITL